MSDAWMRNTTNITSSVPFTSPGSPLSSGYQRDWSRAEASFRSMNEIHAANRNDLMHDQGQTNLPSETPGEENLAMAHRIRIHYLVRD